MGQENTRVIFERPNWSIKQIAYELGYKWSEDFSKFMKRETGKTPTQIRKSGKDLWLVLKETTGTNHEHAINPREFAKSPGEFA